jgi:plasmid stabilization system protein ParE
MAKKAKYYRLTVTAEKDFQEAKVWSLSRWGTEQTKKYFKDLHEGAERLGRDHLSYVKKENLAGINGLCVHAIREHYIVYVPMDEHSVVIVALIRQSRGVPAILKANHYLINRELKQIFTG